MPWQVRLLLGYNAGEPVSAKEEQVAGAATSTFNVPGRQSAEVGGNGALPPPARR